MEPHPITDDRKRIAIAVVLAGMTVIAVVALVVWAIF
jgi:hypothetical protein